MELSVFDLFKIGIGPSSSHTVGPMRAGAFLVEKLRKHGLFGRVKHIRVELFGSLASTGKGHNTDKAIVWGLLGEHPDTIDPAQEEPLYQAVVDTGSLLLGGERRIRFAPGEDLTFRENELLPFHPNGMRFTVEDAHGAELYRKVFYSIGGGFIVGNKTARDDQLTKESTRLPWDFNSGAEMLEMAHRSGLPISKMIFENERAWRSAEEIGAGLDRIHDTMQACVERGFTVRGDLPGRLRVERRAPDLYERLSRQNEGAFADPLAVLDWVGLYALAVNEENAAGGRVVTAPTNGAAGIVPAVMRYAEKFLPACNGARHRSFLLTAGAIGILYKERASISGAEVGCQGEVGVACSMAAAGLAEILGGTPEQVENAAEIGMEHNLGLTCDPVDGLVQIPCIERNAMAAVKAINAARIALYGSGHHLVSLDQVMATMKQTGLDMSSRYKETSKGGLAINITEC
ncbi:MAG: L-serine ammonia-lyase [Acidobacteria bacterium]|nr:L-serine ammonia-lyase [Acidobacteriota bacterium]